MSSSPPPLALRLHSGLHAICRLGPDDPVPSWVPRSGFCSITRTADELSVICVQDPVPSEVRAERDRRLIGVEGPLDFSLVGVLATLSTTLANAGISIVAVSTFDTDYLLVREQDVQRAVEALAAAGCVVLTASRSRS